MLDKFKNLTIVGKAVVFVLLLIPLIYLKSCWSVDVTEDVKTVNLDCSKCLGAEQSNGERLRKLRIKKNFTVEMIADSMKVSPRVINMIEDGNTTNFSEYQWTRLETILNR